MKFLNPNSRTVGSSNASLIPSTAKRSSRDRSKFSVTSSICRSLIMFVPPSPWAPHSRSGHFDQARCPHPPADTHADDDVSHAASFAFDQRMSDEARACHPKWVANGDGAAVDVVAGGIDFQTISTI